MKGILIVLSMLLCSVFVSALTGPLNYNGKEYYVVTSTDSTEDSGDEVCAKAGKNCIGYSETTDAVCKLAHTGATSSSSSSGDKSGVYCNGAPQGGVCAGLTDDCHACPACTATVKCNQAIGGLYREMYAECGSGPCKISIFATNVQDLINQVSSINAQLQGCPQSVPSPANRFVKNGNTFVDVVRTSGTEKFTVIVAGSKVTGVKKGQTGSCVQKVTVSESDLNSALNSQNLGQAVAYLIGQKKAKISGCSFISKVKFFFVNPFARFAAKKVAPSLPPPKPKPNCGNVGEQCNNRGCVSGMCGAPKENVNGQWRYVNYRCIDQKTYTANCLGKGNTPPAWQCLTGPCS